MVRDSGLSDGDGEPRGLFGLLLDPHFGTYWAAKVAANIGVWVYNVVAAILVYDLTGSTFLVGLVSVLLFAPQLVLTPFAGALADRSSNHRGLLAIGRTVVALGAGGLAVWTVTAGLERYNDAWAVIGAGLLVGVGSAVSGPAMHALLPALVRPNELGAAVTLSQAPLTVARAVGPAIGTGLLATAGPAAALAVPAAANAAYAVAALRVRGRTVERRADTDTSVRAGLRYLRDNRAVALLLAGVAATGFGVDPVITLTPAIAEQLGGGEALVGAMTSAFGVGAAITVVLLGLVRHRRGTRRLAPAGLVGFGLGLTALAFAPWPAWAVASLAVAGAGMMLGITSLTTELQSRLPEHMRGRVMALWIVCFAGSRPIAAAVNGSVATVFSTQAALLVCVAVLLLGVVASRA